MQLILKGDHVNPDGKTRSSINSSMKVWEVLIHGVKGGGQKCCMKTKKWGSVGKKIDVSVQRKYPSIEGWWWEVKANIKHGDKHKPCVLANNSLFFNTVQTQALIHTRIHSPL
jgi:hypothetical protein